MKKNAKILIIVAVATLLLVGLMIFLIFFPKESEKTEIDNGISMSTSTNDEGMHEASIKTDKDGKIDNNSYGTLIEYTPAKISTIKLENSQGTLEVKSYTPQNSSGESSATEYKIVGYEDYELKSGAPDEIANDAAAVDFSKVMTLDKDKGSEYGFDKPRATVNVTYTDKTKALIIVGDDAPQSAGTYIKFGDSDTVYLVSTDAVDSFFYGVADMMSLTINNSASDDNNGKASSITISGSNFPKTISLEPNTNSNNSATYMITSPSKGFASETESSNVDGAIRGLYADSVSKVNPSASQLKSLGLSSPYAEIKAVYPDLTVDVMTSAPDGSGNVYLMEKGGKIVYVMKSANLPWVTTSYEKMVSEYVLHPNFASLSKMSVNNGKKTYDFALSSKETTSTDSSGSETSSTTTTVKYGDEEIELSYFSTFFQNVSLTELAKVSTDSASGSPILTVTYTYSSDNSTDTVKFYSTGNTNYLATVNGKTVGYVYKSGINKLIDQVATVAGNKQVDTFAS